MSFASNLKKYRNARGLTQEQLAFTVKVTPQAVSKWETGSSFPDCTYLIQLSDVLGVSIDDLLDHKVNDMTNVTKGIWNIIKDDPVNKRINTVRDICWQMQRGLILADSNKEYMEYESVNDLGSKNASYYIANDGFTQVNHGKAPYFAVFEEKKEGFSSVIGDGEQARHIFEMLSSRDVMNTILHIYKQDIDYAFEAQVLVDEGLVAQDKLDYVLSVLDELKIIYPHELVIDDKPITIYKCIQKHELMALLLVTQDVGYSGFYIRRRPLRNKPFLK